VRFRSVTGKFTTVKNSSKYLIRWNKKSRSKFQTSVKKFLQTIWQHDMVYEELPVAGSKLRFDFYNRSLSIVVEANGPQHTQFHPFFHNKSRLVYLDQIKRDKMKASFCKINEINLIECDYGDDISETLIKKLDINS
tara:strand:- start:1008 stop:1418 length:411 start_codon:yes stop_codon:yes gene_type:complete